MEGSSGVGGNVVMIASVLASCAAAVVVLSAAVDALSSKYDNDFVDVDFGGEQPHLYPEVLSMVKDLEERVLDLGRNSKKQQRKRKVHDEGGGEEAGKAGKVNDGIVLNPNPKARGPTKRIPNTGDGAKRKGRKVTNE